MGLPTDANGNEVFQEYPKRLPDGREAQSAADETRLLAADVPAPVPVLVGPEPEPEPAPVVVEPAPAKPKKKPAAAQKKK
jgi:hypothetical protein